MSPSGGDALQNHQLWQDEWKECPKEQEESVRT